MAVHSTQCLVLSDVVTPALQHWPGDIRHKDISGNHSLFTSWNLGNHFFNQVLQAGLVLVHGEGEWLAVGNVQVHGVLQGGCALGLGHVQQGLQACGQDLNVKHLGQPSGESQRGSPSPTITQGSWEM